MNQSLNSAMIDDAQAQAAQSYADHFGEGGREDPDKLYIDQRYEGYTAENQEVWQTLYDLSLIHISEPTRPY